MVYSRSVLMTLLTVGAASTAVLAAPVLPAGAGGTEAPPTSMGKPNTDNTGDGAPHGPRSSGGQKLYVHLDLYFYGFDYHNHRCIRSCGIGGPGPSYSPGIEG